MKYRDTYRIVTQVSRYVSHHDFMYRATPSDVCPNRDETHRIDGSSSSVLSVRMPSLIVLLPFCSDDYLTPVWRTRRTNKDDDLNNFGCNTYSNDLKIHGGNFFIFSLCSKTFRVGWQWVEGDWVVWGWGEWHEGGGGVSRGVRVGLVWAEGWWLGVGC